MVIKEDFAELTVPELLQHLWEYTDSLKNNERAKYWFWVLKYKLYCEEHLRGKWRPYLQKLNFVLKKINELNILYCLGTFNDSEKYMEFLTKVKDERKRIRSRVGRRL